MAFTDLEKQLVKNVVGGLCRNRTKPHLKDKLRFDYKIKNQDVIVMEIRPGWRDPSKITESEFAKLKYVRSARAWKLYWRRANGKWLRYETEKYSEDLEYLVKEIDLDAYGCFFG